jgi:hypothetical protein
MMWGGELAVMEKVDDVTFTITFAQPFPTWPETLSSSTVSGLFNAGETGGGMVSPHHYMEQFHADFAGEEEANQLATDAGFENWYLNFLAKNNAHMNPELPGLTPWIPVTTIADSEYVLERNHLLGEDDLLLQRGAASPMRHRPLDAHPAIGREPPLPAPLELAPLDLVIRHPHARQVPLQPGAQLLAKRIFHRGEFEPEHEARFATPTVDTRQGTPARG